ncbi:uncharacterized protein LOC134204557 [Armigeres subalbatus]|uniref:uncharacterized protein LOC134204557 n=1 Tax=Armigeres subalbatus TaxID=124917 RepID=UPI002ED642EF
MQQTVYGEQLLKAAETHCLSDSGRKFVVDTVARYHLTRNCKTSSEVVEDLSTVICGLFKKESKETYYIPKAKNRGNPAGKLYSRINYIKQSERKRDQKEKHHISTDNDLDNEQLLPEVATALAWLEINRFPWATVLSQWELSFPARKADLRQFSKAGQLINTYPHLSNECGYQLLDIEYRKLGLGNPTEPSKKWNSLFEPIAKYISKYAKDPSAKDLSYALRNNELSIDCRLLNLLLALNTVLIPVKASKGFKPTVATGQAETFLLVDNKDQALTELEKTIQIYEEQRFAIAPKLIVVGENLTAATGECLVVYKDIIYNLPTIVRGVDVLLKLQIVLGLPVAKFSKLVWVFIEQFVYEVPSNYGGYLCINKLIQFLNSQSENQR